MPSITKENGNIIQVSGQIEQTLCDLGLKLMAVLSADLTSKATLPKSYGQYATSKIFFNNMYVHVFYGRSIRWGEKLQPTHHMIRLLSETLPLMSLILQHSHLTVGCGFRAERYMRHVRFSGFMCMNLQNAVNQHIKFCRLCPLIKTILTKKNPAEKLADRYLRGPSDLVQAILDVDPMSIMQIDKSGSMFLGNQNGYT